MIAPRTVPCPTCRAPVDWTPQSRWRPFCSERCKLIDAGAWATEAYRVPVSREQSETVEDVDDAQPQRGKPS